MTREKLSKNKKGLTVRQGWGKRIQELRQLTGLSRKEFAEKHCDIGITYSTYEKWESEYFDKISLRARKLLRYAFDEEDVVYNDRWLVEGEGVGPIKLSHVRERTADWDGKPSISSDEDRLVLQDLQEYKRYHGETIHLVVPDETMSPRFVKGEYVAGDLQPINDIEDFIGKDCIVRTTAGEILIRKFSKRIEYGKYLFSCVNLSNENEGIILNKDEIISLAPVSWHRIKVYSG